MIQLAVMWLWLINWITEITGVTGDMVTLCVVWFPSCCRRTLHYSVSLSDWDNSESVGPEKEQVSCLIYPHLEFKKQCLYQTCALGLRCTSLKVSNVFDLCFRGGAWGQRMWPLMVGPFDNSRWPCSVSALSNDELCLKSTLLDLPGSWSQSSISRSLQRAETLLRTTFNPSLKWLFHGRGQDEDTEQGHFVVAHNLVSRSSTHLLRLQQALLTVAPQWQLVNREQMGSPQVRLRECRFSCTKHFNFSESFHLSLIFRL